VVGEEAEDSVAAADSEDLVAVVDSEVGVGDRVGKSGKREEGSGKRNSRGF
jgi:hypothetical protein